MDQTEGRLRLVSVLQLAIAGLSLFIALIGAIHFAVALLMLLPGLLGLLVRHSTFVRVCAIFANVLNILFWCHAACALVADPAVVNQDAVVCLLPLALIWVILCVFAGVAAMLLRFDEHGRNIDG